MKKAFSLILLVIIALGVYWLISSDKNLDNSSATTFFTVEDILPGDKVIRQTDDGYEPAEITVSVGTRVVWLNETDTFIWPASNIHPTHRIYLEFDPKKPFAPGEAWAFIFDKEGQWEFHDHLRSYNQGMVKVTP